MSSIALSLQARSLWLLSRFVHPFPLKNSLSFGVSWSCLLQQPQQCTKCLLPRFQTIVYFTVAGRGGQQKGLPGIPLGAGWRLHWTFCLGYVLLASWELVRVQSRYTWEQVVPWGHAQGWALCLPPTALAVALKSQAPTGSKPRCLRSTRQQWTLYALTYCCFMYGK